MTTSPEICHPQLRGRLMDYLFVARPSRERQSEFLRMRPFQQVFWISHGCTYARAFVAKL
jgi:hypothetical protein